MSLVNDDTFRACTCTVRCTHFLWQVRLYERRPTTEEGVMWFCFIAS